MRDQLVDAITALIDAKIAYALASAEVGEDDHRGSCVHERQAVEAAEKALRDALGTIEQNRDTLDSRVGWLEEREATR